MQASILKETKIQKQKIAEIQTMTQAIYQAAIKATKVAVRDITEVADLADYSTRRNAAVSGHKATAWQLR